MSSTIEAAWQRSARERAIEQFRNAWAGAPPAGREALVEAAARGRVGHKWETGRHACVLALLVRPALRPSETPKMAAYRWFGCEVTEDFPPTWDGLGVTLPELLASVGVTVPERRRGLSKIIAGGLRTAAVP